MIDKKFDSNSSKNIRHRRNRLAWNVSTVITRNGKKEARGCDKRKYKRRKPVQNMKFGSHTKYLENEIIFTGCLFVIGWLEPLSMTDQVR